MKKIRVMHVLNTRTYSGAENVAISIIQGTAEKCESVYVSLNGTIREVLESQGIKYLPLKNVSVSEITRAIQKCHPDIIHAHDFTAGIISALTMTDIPIINHIHNNSPWIKKYGIYSFAYYAATLRFKKILTVSPSVMDEYVFGKKLIKKVSVIGNPINTSYIRELAGRLDEEKQYDVAFLGRLTIQKDPMAFLQIVNLLKKEKTNLKCIMIGDGEMREEVKTQIRSYQLEECIDLVGFQKNPYTFLKSARVCCMPSRWEGFGLAAVEALALGIPVVAAPVGGLVTIINQSCGFFCEDPLDYTEKIRKLLENADLYSQLSANAMRHADEMNNILEYSRSMISAYYNSLKIK